MKAGKMRWPVTIQSPTFTQNPATGEKTVTGWTTFATVYADIEPIARAGSRAAWEIVIAQQIKARKVAQFDIRYIPGITEIMRVVDYYGGIWDIRSIVNVDTRNRELWLICEFGLTQG